MLIGSTLVDVGFAVKWYDPVEEVPRPELQGSHPLFGTLAVEGKSRHRPGVLGQAGELGDGGNIGDVRGLFADATEKDPDGKPFAIFLDCNIPVSITPANQESLLAEANQLAKDMAGHGRPGSGFGAVFITNYAYHYHTADQPFRGWFMVVSGGGPQLLSKAMVQALAKSLLAYPQIPEVAPE